MNRVSRQHVQCFYSIAVTSFLLAVVDMGSLAAKLKPDELVQGPLDSIGLKEDLIARKTCLAEVDSGLRFD